MSYFIARYLSAGYKYIRYKVSAANVYLHHAPASAVHLYKCPTFKYIFISRSNSGGISLCKRSFNHIVTGLRDEELGQGILL